MQVTNSSSASNPEIDSTVATVYGILVAAATANFVPLVTADALDVAADALTARVHGHAADIRKQANALLPIYKLPVELLVLVSRCAVANLHFKIKRLVALTSVSSRLRDVLTSERSLWTSIEWEAPQYMVSLALQRSYPRCVELDIEGWEETLDEERQESPLLQEVLAQGSRLKSGGFTILQSSHPRIPPLTADVFPHLTSFTLVVVPDRPDETLVRPLQSISLVGPPPPSLRRLRIHGLTVELVPSVWVALERLILLDTGITTSSILEILRHCHHLRYLEVGGDVLVSPMPEGQQAVTSESITSIAFGGESIQFLHHLLPLVAFPNCRSFFVILGEEPHGDPSPNAIAAFAYASRVMLPTHSTRCPNTFSANIHNNRFMLSLGRKDIGNKPKYRLEVFIPSTYQSLPLWVVQLVQLQPLLYSCSLRIAINTPTPDDEGDDDEEEEEDYRYEVHECHDREGCDIDEVSLHPIQILSELFDRGVDDLSIYGASPFGIYRAMSKRRSRGWLLPAVRTLSILGPAKVDLNPLLDLLRTRFPRSGFPGGPLPFQFIHLPPQLEGRPEWVEKILGITGHSTTIASNPL